MRPCASSCDAANDRREQPAFDGNGNPVQGKVVRFAASLGTITALDTTDADYHDLEVGLIAAAALAITWVWEGKQAEMQAAAEAKQPEEVDPFAGEIRDAAHSDDASAG
mgnify:CR=1 FL=1